MKKVKRILSMFMSVLMIMTCLTCAFTVYAEGEEKTEEPLITIACISDLHTQGTDLSIPRLRDSVADTLKKLHDTEDIDLLVLGGDYTSDTTSLSQSTFNALRDVFAETMPTAFSNDRKAAGDTPVLFVAGNHEYTAGRYMGYDSSDFYTYPMEDMVGELSGDTDPEIAEGENAFYEWTNDKLYKILAAYSYNIGGFDFVVLNTGIHCYDSENGTGSYSDYIYSDASVEWVKNKLAEIYADDNDKTVFFLAHIPFNDSNSIRAGKGLDMSDSATILLKETLSQYPNLVYLYGHDHGGDTAYIRQDTAQRVTQYDSNGNVINTTNATKQEVTLPEEEIDPNAYYITNKSSGKYLGADGNLNTVTEKSISTVTGDGGTFNIAVDRESQPNVYFSSGSKTFSGNTNPVDLSLYQVTGTDGNTYTAESVSEIESGADYIVVCQSGGTYYALTNETNGSTGASLRLLPATVSVSGKTLTYTDDLTNDEYSAVWSFVSLADEDAKESGYYITNAQDGKYLAISGNLNTVENKSVSKIAETDGSFTIEVEGKAAQPYVYFSSGSKTFSSNSEPRNLTLFKVIGGENGTYTAVKSSKIENDAQYLITYLNSGTYYALTNETNGLSGNDMRILPVTVSVDGDNAVYTDSNTSDDYSALWNISTAKSDDGDKTSTSSFFSSFMGSMRYYSNTIENNYYNNVYTATGDWEPNIWQALLVYVYADRVELSMKNYGASGTFGSTGVTIDQEPATYVNYRTVSNSGEKDKEIETYVNEVFSLQFKGPSDVKDIKMVNESGKKVSVLSFTGEPSGKSTLWTVKTKMGTAGIGRKLTVQYVNSNGYIKDAGEYTVNVLEHEVEAKVMEFASDSVARNMPVGVKTITSGSAKGIKICNENNGIMGKKLISKRLVSNGDIEWNYDISIGTAGENRTFTSKAFGADGVLSVLTASDTITVTK